MSKIVILSCWSAHFSYWAFAAFSVKPAQEKAGPAALFGFRLFQIFSFVMLGGIIPFSPFNVRLWSGLPIMNESGTRRTRLAERASRVASAAPAASF